MACEQMGSGSAETCHNLVCNQQGVVAAGNFRDLLKPTVWLWYHARRALHSGFVNKTSILMTLFFLRGKFLFYFSYTLPMAPPILPCVSPLWFRPVEGTAITKRRHHLVRFKQHAAIGSVK